VTRTFKEMCALTRVPKTEIGRCYKILERILDTKPKTVNTVDFIARHCSVLEMPEMQKVAIEIVNNATAVGCVDGKSPLTIAAAAIYLITMLFPKYRDAQKRIALVTGVSDATIKHSYREMHPHRHKIVPSSIAPEEMVESLPML
jgi:transcription initiation factor TFIIB